jgi:hypothetical protein
MAATNKCLARNNKTPNSDKATNRCASAAADISAASTRHDIKEMNYEKVIDRWLCCHRDGGIGGSVFGL